MCLFTRDLFDGYSTSCVTEMRAGNFLYLYHMLPSVLGLCLFLFGIFNLCSSFELGIISNHPFR